MKIVNRNKLKFIIISCQLIILEKIFTDEMKKNTRDAN